MTPKTTARRSGAALAAVLAGALALTACGSGSDGDKSASGDKSAAAKGDRTVKTVMGDVKVPVEPKRVVALDTAELDSLITLGVKPVGATRTDSPSGFPAHLPADQVAGVKLVGEMAAPNMEAIAALDPDLILTSKLRHGDKYDELKAIAPTVMTESTGLPWKENFLVHADALGKKDEAAKAVTEYSARTAEVTTALGGKDKAAGIEVNLVRFVEGADIRIYGKENYVGTIFKDVGLGRPAVTDKAEEGFMLNVSPEKIDMAEADVIFHSTIGDPEKAKATQVLGSPLWKNLDAVKRGDVHPVKDEVWIQAIGYTGAAKILDELEAALTK
ncbi:ABC transporter substrate-binding protein [Streptomyces uncialis]|uniref:Iron-siderophore ABC transporter substrate-binding protein n=1 Tax=Streptomyces uncialis TaxID=1048205 RepID=A0A1Q4V6M7_9ACTN|nr:iron-siderophore ABC transporter substrate-binding protein [Streptomyces uncialis]MCX4659405.1 iron-siderophore ABC transporter substrate-binding protein [Streptomyces uncialis]OKH93491.1 iron-siderophore ABC transporter substrate-binding protein [Streptomyces uncialis]WTE13818.1 iron-siderophore ABC transporter substrate-binding protein [Streptomyces uncialis]